MNVVRETKLDALFSSFVLIGFVLVVAGNLLASGASTTPQWLILAGLIAGVFGAAILSARVFWRHRIGLNAWLLMFGIHAVGMAMATQIFNWLHPGGRAEGASVGINALLLAFALIVVMLVRGAVLLDAASRMPGWLAARSEKLGATPRLWLFALYWMSPLAWWAGILSAVDIFILNDSASAPMAALILCVAIAVGRFAVRLVLFEKNKYTNWQRSPEGRVKARAYMTSAGFALAGALSFYAYFFMAARVQDDAFAAQVKHNAEARAAEIAAMQPPALAPKENAETIYKLSRASLAPINWHWARASWNTQEARTEIARNLTALSYLRQAAAVRGIDYGIDWSADTRKLEVPVALMTSMGELSGLALLELRQAADKEDWQTSTKNFSACLRYARHLGALPMVDGSGMALDVEIRSTEVLAAALFKPGAQPPDTALVDFQKALAEHLDARGEYCGRAVYFTFVSHYGGMDRARLANEFPGKASVSRMLKELALIDWHRQIDEESFMASLKLMTRQHMDQDEVRDITRRVSARRPMGSLTWNDLCVGTATANLNALESLRLLEAAIAIKRYQRHYGAWPSALKDCIPLFLTEIPPDPNKKGRFVQYDSSPPRVYTIGTGMNCDPQQHGQPDENYFNAYSLSIKHCENGNHVLFLAN